MKNTGKEYEHFVAELQQAILNAEDLTTQKNIKVEVNKKIVDNNGVERQFDIYWEYELGGLTYKTIIECKDYNSDISIEKIDALIGKIRDIPDLKGVFATKKGYQSGAQNKAEKNRIDLLIVREQNDSDWTDKDGTPLIKRMGINLLVCSPARIHKFEPFVNGAWLRANTTVDPTKPIQLNGFHNEIFIDDIGRGEKYSLHELADKLSPLDNKKFGVFHKEEKFTDAFIDHKGTRLKLDGYKIEYSLSEPINKPIEIDFSKELIGVIEYLQKGTKKSIFRNGIIKSTERPEAGPG